MTTIVKIERVAFIEKRVTNAAGTINIEEPMDEATDKLMGTQDKVYAKANSTRARSRSLDLFDRKRGNSTTCGRM